MFSKIKIQDRQRKRNAQQRVFKKKKREQSEKWKKIHDIVVPWKLKKSLRMELSRVPNDTPISRIL